MVIAKVSPTEWSPYRGKFAIAYLSFFVRCSNESEVVPAYHRLLQEDGLNEVEALDAGYFVPSPHDPELRDTILKALNDDGVFSIICGAAPGDNQKFSRN